MNCILKLREQYLKISTHCMISLTSFLESKSAQLTVSMASRFGKCFHSLHLSLMQTFNINTICDLEFEIGSKM